MPADHYTTLGLPAEASADDVRTAYRRLARQLHPDRRAGAGDEMASLNEAYRVLGDPGRRAVYDAARRTGSAAASSASRSASASWTMPTPTRLAPLEPARIPWRLMGVMAAVGAAVVIALAALARPTPPPPPDNLLEPGSCVEIEVNGDAREITCSGAVGERVVRALVARPERCPVGTEARRDRQGRGTACLEPLVTG